MKVVITSNTTWNILHFRKPIISALLAEGHQVVAVAPADGQVEPLENLGVRHIPVRMDSKGLDPIKDLRLFTDFRRIFRQETPDIVLSYTIKNNIYGALAARSARVPFLPNVSGLGTVFLKRGWLELIATTLYRAAFRRLKFVVFQNSDDRDLFVDRDIIRSEQAVLVPGSGIDLDYFRPHYQSKEEGEGHRFILISRMLRDKGVVEYVRAAEAVKKEFPHSQFLLAGACSVENRTAIDLTTVENWVRAGHVEYLGKLSDVRTVLADADCVVLPSYREGLPRVLLEGGAMGKPLIATDVPGCRDVVDDRITGILCRVRSSESLCEAMKLFLSLSAEKKLEMGKAGRRKVENEFGQDRVVEVYRRVISELTI